MSEERMENSGGSSVAGNSDADAGCSDGVDDEQERRTNAALKDYNIINNSEVPSSPVIGEVAANTSQQSGRDDGQPVPVVFQYPQFETTIAQKIVLCVDIAEELDKPSLASKDGTKYSYLEVVKSLLIKFLKLLSYMNNEKDVPDQYALVVFGSKPTIVHKFSKDVKSIVTFINGLRAPKLQKSGEVFDMSQLFETIDDLVCPEGIDSEGRGVVDCLRHLSLSHLSHPPQQQQVGTAPPDYILRCVLLYARSDCIPDISNIKRQQQIHQSPYYFIDVLYLHGPLHADDNNAKYMFETIYGKLREVDMKERSYLHTCGPDITQLHNKMVQFIGHPLQRPKQAQHFIPTTATTGTP